ncbi:LysR family transcriptional regulator [Lentzea albida]|uniref:DNA-binding transcriptional regulator, LysR family n=1 Tax=Lentzea albida TaxID=65499 RepID=A0A1H9W7L6_9PSEU|nr:LysR family transcriptional regulator [Lentzea albida]SES29759.1 DNA-binding transcriptional regulator, LysR family [Lentzea albida]
MDVSSANLRVLCQIAESGSFTAAATELGYTQSAVSRQAIALERSAGTTLFERRTDGVRLTRSGLTLLRHARAILASVDAAERDLTGEPPRTEQVRLGLVPSAGPVVLSAALTRLARTAPRVRVTTREGTTPSLARALRSGAIDVAVLVSRPPHRPPDAESPRLHVTTVEDTELVVAAPATGVFAGRTSVHVDELADVPWIASPSSGAEPLLGVWPGLGRARVVHAARDWLTKLHLVAGGFGVTTIPARFSALVPAGVTSLRVEGAPPEIRRVLVAHLPGAATPAVAAVVEAITASFGP